MNASEDSRVYIDGYVETHASAVRRNVHKWCGIPCRSWRNVLHDRNCCSNHCKRWRDVACCWRLSDVLHRSWCSIHCWSWGNEIHERGRCSNHCKRWRGGACRWHRSVQFSAPQGPGPDWLLSSPARDKRAILPGVLLLLLLQL